MSHEQQTDFGVDPDHDPDTGIFNGSFTIARLRPVPYIMTAMLGDELLWRRFTLSECSFCMTVCHLPAGTSMR